MVGSQQLRYILDAINYVLLKREDRNLQYLQLTFTNIINRTNVVYQQQHVVACYLFFCLFVCLVLYDAGRDWGQEEKGMREDEMAGWHH